MALNSLMPMMMLRFRGINLRLHGTGRLNDQNPVGGQHGWTAFGSGCCLTRLLLGCKRSTKDVRLFVENCPAPRCLRAEDDGAKSMASDVNARITAALPVTPDEEYRSEQYDDRQPQSKQRKRICDPD